MLSLHSSMYATTHEAIARCKAERRCIQCGEKFSETNVYTKEGALETQISGICERCFDEIFEGEE